MKITDLSDSSTEKFHLSSSQIQGIFVSLHLVRTSITATASFCELPVCPAVLTSLLFISVGEFGTLNISVPQFYC